MTTNQFRCGDLVATYHTSINEIDPEHWDACVGNGRSCEKHSHLVALETSGIATEDQGYRPHHVVLKQIEGKIVGVAPCYLKGHSEGELGIDLGLPLAHQRSVGPYYPKLYVGVPTFPLSKALIVRPDADAGATNIKKALLSALLWLADIVDSTTVQISHLSEIDVVEAQAAGFATGEGMTFVWNRRDAIDFGTWIARFNKKGRYRIRNERKLVAELGLQFDRLQGDKITPSMADLFYELYVSTFKRYGAKPHLNMNYFEKIFTSMTASTDILVARSGSLWVAAMLSMKTSNGLQVQHWGQSGCYSNLIFEFFYRQFEHAFAHGLDRLEFGPSGRHKALRGIEMIPTHHALWFRDANFQQIAELACERQRARVRKSCLEENARLPFRP